MKIDNCYYLVQVFGDGYAATDNLHTAACMLGLRRPLWRMTHKAEYDARRRADLRKRLRRPITFVDVAGSEDTERLSPLED